MLILSLENRQMKKKKKRAGTEKTYLLKYFHFLPSAAKWFISVNFKFTWGNKGREI